MIIQTHKLDRSKSFTKSYIKKTNAETLKSYKYFVVQPIQFEKLVFPFFCPGAT